MREITSRRLKEVKAWVKEVYKKDDYKCTNCGSSENLSAHHIIGWHEDKNLRVELSNGITLCNVCHQKHHATGKKQSAETIAKRIESRKWYKHSKETIQKQKLNAGRPKGIPMKPEQKELYRKIFTGRITSEETKAKQRKNAGRPKGPLSQEEKEKRKLYCKERVLTLDPQTGKRKWIKK